MDAGMASLGAFDKCLRQIEKINFLTGGYRPIFQWLEKLPDGPLTIADIGCGRGGLLRQIRQWANRSGVELHLEGIDINPWSKQAAEDATPPDMQIHYRIVDITTATVAADYIVCSHMTHHLDDESLVAFLKRLDACAARGWFICDLHRHALPYFAIKYALCLAPIDPMVRNDGAASVSRAFTADDWRCLLERADIPPSEYSIKWFFPFRYGVMRRKFKTGGSG